MTTIVTHIFGDIEAIRKELMSAFWRKEMGHSKGGLGPDPGGASFMLVPPCIPAIMCKFYMHFWFELEGFPMQI